MSRSFILGPFVGTLAAVSSIIALAPCATASAQEASTAKSTASPSGDAKKLDGAHVAAVDGEQATREEGYATGPLPDRYENAWVGWDTGGKDAGLGLGLFGHLGVGHRFNSSPVGDASPDGVVSDNGFLIGIDAIVRFNRYVGVGVGYEHAGLGQDRQDALGSPNFNDIFRNLNTLWFQGRVYPVRVDPFALYINVAVGPSWQNVNTSTTSVDINGGTNAAGNCSGGHTAGLGLRGAVGAELALVSGLTFFTEIGPDGYFQSTDVLNNCAVGSGTAGNLGFRAGFAFGLEKSRRKAKPGDEDKDGIADDKDFCPHEPGVASSDPKKNGCPLPRDTDGDGIADRDDYCPTVPGVKSSDPTRNGCPPDRDGDGIIDTEDACPDVPGIKTSDPKTNGCPDRDKDGVADKEDACPDVPGVRTSDPKTNGCPGDRDGDGIADDKDACPDDPGKPDPDPKKNGCPLVVVREGEIVINEQVQFDTGLSTIKPVSDVLLNTVADVLKAHQEILKIEIQGHTDNVGSKPMNKQLSDSRANAVLKALTKRGIDGKRLTAHGYGEEVPLVPNDSDANRATNRRVQFKILEKNKSGAPPVTVVAPTAKQVVVAPPPPKPTK